MYNIWNTAGTLTVGKKINGGFAWLSLWELLEGCESPIPSLERSHVRAIGFITDVYHAVCHVLLKAYSQSPKLAKIVHFQRKFSLKK